MSVDGSATRGGSPGTAGDPGEAVALGVRDLGVSFGGVVAVTGVSFDVAAGERVGLIGPNGAGKTTLFNLVSGWVRPTSGSVSLGGRDVTAMAPQRLVRQGLTRTFQRTQLCGSLSVVENVELATLAAAGVSGRAWRAVRGHSGACREAAALLEELGLGAVGPAPSATLSYGVQRQAEVAVALATRPSVLLLDEPTSGLSPAETTEMLRFLDRATGGITVLVIEHDMDVLFGLVGRVLVMQSGALIADGTAEEIRADEAVREAYLGRPGDRE